MIAMLRTTDPRLGYNRSPGGDGANSPTAREKMSIAHTGLKESNDTKRKKSNIIICINPVERKVILADGGKLFADYIGSSKDYIKNCLRQPCVVKGFLCYYNNKEKREEILKKMYAKRSIRNHTYVDIGEFLNSIDHESVETIYDTITEKYGNIYDLKYENTSKDGSLFLTEHDRNKPFFIYTDEDIEKELNSKLEPDVVYYLEEV